jgi:hypothetical protein
MAWAMEALTRNRFSGDPGVLREIDARFTRPLVLPADVGLHIQDDQLWVADAPGAPAYMTASFRSDGAGTETDGEAK